MSAHGAIVGVSDHCGWAVLVTVAGDGTFLDRRRVELVGEGLPKLPHHHEGQMLLLEEALELVERVRVSANHHAALGLDALASAVPSRIRGIVLRECPRLPPTVAERIQGYRANTVADTVMYRHALAAAAEARGWGVHWYAAKGVLASARAALHVDDIEAHFLQLRKTLGPPWQKDHTLAMAAAIVAAQPPRPESQRASRPRRNP
jgi:hypothetical protein